MFEQSVLVMIYALWYDLDTPLPPWIKRILCLSLRNLTYLHNHVTHQSTSSTSPLTVPLPFCTYVLIFLTLTPWITSRTLKAYIGITGRPAERRDEHQRTLSFDPRDPSSLLLLPYALFPTMSSAREAEAIAIARLSGLVTNQDRSLPAHLASPSLHTAYLNLARTSDRGPKRFRKPTDQPSPRLSRLRISPTLLAEFCLSPVDSLTPHPNPTATAPSPLTLPPPRPTCADPSPLIPDPLPLPTAVTPLPTSLFGPHFVACALSTLHSWSPPSSSPVSLSIVQSQMINSLLSALAAWGYHIRKRYILRIPHSYQVHLHRFFNYIHRQLQSSTNHIPILRPTSLSLLTTVWARTTLVCTRGLTPYRILHPVPTRLRPLITPTLELVLGKTPPTCKCNQVRRLADQFASSPPILTSDGHLIARLDLGIFRISARSPLPTQLDKDVIPAFTSEILASFGPLASPSLLPDTSLWLSRSPPTSPTPPGPQRFISVRKTYPHVVFSELDKDEARLSASCPAQYLLKLLELFIPPATRKFILLKTQVRTIKRDLVFCAQNDLHTDVFTLRTHLVQVCSRLKYLSRSIPYLPELDIPADLLLRNEELTWSPLFPPWLSIPVRHTIPVARITFKAKDLSRARPIVGCRHMFSKKLGRLLGRCIRTGMKVWSKKTDVHVCFTTSDVKEVLSLSWHTFRSLASCEKHTMDIENMFTNIRHDLVHTAFQAMKQALGESIYFVFLKDDLKVCTLTSRKPNPQLTRYLTWTDLSEILYLELSRAYFLVGDILILQKLGCGMGRPASPDLSCLVVFYLKYMATLKTSPVPDSISTSYMDDSFEINLASTPSWLTTVYTPILKDHGMNLKLESSSTDGTIQFMQYCIDFTQPTPTFYYKPRAKHRYIEYSTHTSPRYYTSLVMSLLCTLEQFCSNHAMFLIALKAFLLIWRQRRWPFKLIKYAFIWYLRKRHHSILKAYLPDYLDIWRNLDEESS